MKNMTLKNIAIACGGILHTTDAILEETEVQGVVLDSRKVERDYLFLATKGERVDGHDFIGQVFEREALCVVCEEMPEAIVGNYIVVTDSFRALKQIAEFYRRQISLKVVGITGSVGKTSTKEMISSVLQEKYEVLKTEGNFNNEIGLPLTILRIREQHEVAVLEMGINQFGEMTRLSYMAKPDICVITNIGQCHLEFLGSREGILQAKSEIFTYMSPEGSVCLYGEDDLLRNITQVHEKAPIYFGKKEDCDCYADEINSLGIEGTKCNIHTPEGDFAVVIAQPGMHMVDNALAAVAVGRQLGLSIKQMQEGISKAAALPGRGRFLHTKEYTIIDDCYNANPVSMKAAIDLLMLAQGRKVALLGDMGELGADASKLHYEVGAYAANSGVDILVFVGELSIEMQNASNDIHHLQTYYFPTKESIKAELPNILKPQDTILVKASHFMGFEDIVADMLCRG